MFALVNIFTIGKKMPASGGQTQDWAKRENSKVACRRSRVTRLSAITHIGCMYGR